MTDGNDVGGTGVPPVTDSGPTGRETNREARMWAMFCHLAALASFVIPLIGLVIGPLVVWLIKKEQYPFVDEQGKEAINFQISMLIYIAVSSVLVLACGIGFVLITIVGILDLVFLIIATIKANDGYHYRYPLSIHFIK